MAAEGTSAEMKVETTGVEDPKVAKQEDGEQKPTEGKKNNRFTKEYSEERRRAWEETQKLKPVIETGLKGKVKWYSIKGRYGFIDREDGKGDVFIHQSVIAKSHTLKYYLRTLENDEEVLFDVVQGNKGPEASNVTGPNGDPVQGSKYFYVLLKNRRRPRQNKDAKKNDHETKKLTEKKDQVEKKKQVRRPRRKDTKKKDGSVPQKDDKEPVSNDDEKKGPQRRRRASSTSGEKPTTIKDTNEKPNGAILGGGDASLGSAAPVDAQI